MAAYRQSAIAVTTTVRSAGDIAALVEKAQSIEELDASMRIAYRAYADGKLTEAEIERLDAEIRARRPGRQIVPSTLSSFMKKVGRFAPRKYQHSPDKVASRERRRTLGGSSALPPALRSHFTESKRAVLFIIRQETMAYGACTCSIAEIAARAGVSRSTAQAAIREASALRLLRVIDRPVLGAKNLTNKIKIISKVWLRWSGFKKNTKVDPTKIKYTSETRKKEKLTQRDIRPIHDGEMTIYPPGVLTPAEEAAGSDRGQQWLEARATLKADIAAEDTRAGRSEP